MSHCAHDRQASRTCMHSVTDRDRAFRLAVVEKKNELYSSVISSTELDNWLPFTESNSGT
jgi:hypothetical protein